jgi:hypothetical protein
MDPRSELDVRVPVGALFAVLGVLLLGYGFTTPAQGTNINVVWGGVMLVFGAIMLALSRKRTS